MDDFRYVNCRHCKHFDKGCCFNKSLNSVSEPFWPLVKFIEDGELHEFIEESWDWGNVDIPFEKCSRLSKASKELIEGEILEMLGKLKDQIETQLGYMLSKVAEEKSNTGLPVDDEFFCKYFE